MIDILHKWGADYLAFDEPINLDPVALCSPLNITIQPGQVVTQIGKKRRSSFELLPGFSMIYEGLLTLDRIRYAIFHCPAHDQKQLALFEPSIQYRYAFACVFVTGRFQCFLSGPGGPAGMRDIQLDYVA